LRRDVLYLSDIVDAAEAIDAFLEGFSYEQFLADALRQSAVLQKLTVIGEASARLSPEIKATAPSIPWTKIVGFRNVAVHAYFHVDWSVVWLAAKEDVPVLKSHVQTMLSLVPGDD